MTEEFDFDAELTAASEEAVKLLRKKIKDGTATAADMANLLKIMQERGFKWRSGTTPGAEAKKPDLPSFDDEDEDEPIPFVR